uniref:Putative single-stranded DNA binding protein n=1 Tax=Sheathia arcuata TaxID=340433 RepID=A0A3G1I991_9FLOR|nr:putative single-stranded DNA binding protein [Sheathia arcuata]ART65503.1 putative single-stranded DNA binding protein [Sheathia arcuata]
MNISIFTVQIATWPKKYMLHTGKEIIKLYLRIPNPKKGKSFYYIKCHAQNKWKKQVFDWYQKGDYLILEGSLKLNTFKLHDFKSKYLEVSIIKDFPMNLQI